MAQTGKVSQVLFKVTLCLELAAELTLSWRLEGNRLEAFGSCPGAGSRLGEKSIPKVKDAPFSGNPRIPVTFPRLSHCILCVRVLQPFRFPAALLGHIYPKHLVMMSLSTSSQEFELY